MDFFKFAKLYADKFEPLTDDLAVDRLDVLDTFIRRHDTDEHTAQLYILDPAHRKEVHETIAAIHERDH